ncbi:MAG: hypothetical protein J6Y07_01105 [Alphaproteobacteria bacterium]|nr:hypothetical protein [Alphaproteobacteria bacterium]
MATSTYNDVPLGSFEDMIAIMDKDLYARGEIINYMQNHFIPLEIFGKVLRLYLENGSKQSMSWDTFYHSCIPVYFRSSGIRAMQQFVANGCSSDDIENVQALLEFHPGRNSLVSEIMKGEQFLSWKQKLLYDALVKAEELFEKYENEKKSKSPIRALPKPSKDAYETAIVSELLRILDDPEQHVSVESELIGSRPQTLKYSAYLDKKKLLTLYETEKLEVYSDSESPLTIKNRNLLLPLEEKVGDLLILQIDAQTEKQDKTLNWLRGIGGRHN